MTTSSLCDTPRQLIRDSRSWPICIRNCCFPAFWELEVPEGTQQIMITGGGGLGEEWDAAPASKLNEKTSSSVWESWNLHHEVRCERLSTPALPALLLASPFSGYHTEEATHGKAYTACFRNTPVTRTPSGSAWESKRCKFRVRPWKLPWLRRAQDQGA
jgi:hypothetical protein